MKALLLLLLLPAARAAAFTQTELSARYYSDLGPAEVDVSSYPPEEQRNYEVFRRVCSSCHTPARALNSPVATREGWRGYVSEMRMRGALKKEPVPDEDELAAVISFLTYDGRVRKLERRAEFEAQSRRLQKEFWRTIEERMRRLQQNLPEVR